MIFLTSRESDRERDSSGEGERDTYSDLTKKLNYLNIAIDSDKQHQDDYFATLEPPLYPSFPLWPKKGLFHALGISTRVSLLLVFVAAIREYSLIAAPFIRLILSVKAKLDIPLLGEPTHFPV